MALDPDTGLPVLVKQPSEDRLYDFDLSELLGSATISGVVMVGAQPQGRVAGSQDVTLGVPSHDGQARVQVRIGGGTDGEAYKITCRVTDSAGNTLEAEGMLYVREL